MPAGGVQSPIATYLEELHHDVAQVDAGAVATYIPELGGADPERFAICVCTTDGYVYAVGDAELQFTIQSISKPFVYGVALEDNGRDAVLARIGVEPSGNAFNAIVVDGDSRPFNPMVNAGAITTTGMVAGEDRILRALGAYAGRTLEVDESVYASERTSGDRNRAIAHLMRSFGVIERDAEAAVDLYFRQCSIAVSCRDLAIMAATLANRGLNPITAERALDEEFVENVLSVMTSCGMYDASGAWMYNVGLPAKSGVCGGVLAVLPGQLGIGVFSPRLDTRGNSTRGVKVCERIAHDLHLHPFRYQLDIGGVVRRSYTSAEVHSCRIRTAAELDVLARHGDSTRVYELQGDLFFATSERVFRYVTDSLDGVETVVLDLRRVVAIDAAAVSMLDRLTDTLLGTGRTLVLAEGDGRPALDDVLEQCEDRILATYGPVASSGATDLSDQELLRGLGAAELRAIEAAASKQRFRAGELVFREGSPADSILFVLDGSLSAVLPAREPVDPATKDRWLARFGPGLAVGELALLGDGSRSADIVADEDTTVAVIGIADLARITGAYSTIDVALHRNLARVLARRLRSANEQLRLLNH
jgi:glutaminase